jgi:curved DNA-binding protein CbpA
MKEYYKILNVARTASKEQIKSSYRALAMKLHPDVSSNGYADEERLKQINEAYNVLYNDTKRAEYDRILAQFEATQAQQQTAGTTSNYKYSKDYEQRAQYQATTKPPVKRKYTEAIIWLIIIGLIGWGYRSCKISEEKEHADNIRHEQYRKEEAEAKEQRWARMQDSLGRCIPNLFQKIIADSFKNILGKSYDKKHPTGKIIVINNRMPSFPIDTLLMHQLPYELWSFDSSVLRTIVFLYRDREKVGAYSSGEPAYRQLVELRFYDIKSEKLIATEMVVGEDPPKEITVTYRRGRRIGGYYDKYGKYPEEKIISAIINRLR